VHPMAIPARTRKSRLAAVLESAASVMGDALAVGGTSFDSLYVNVNGESGYFDRALLVYGRGGQECVRCGNEIQRLSVGGRGTHCLDGPARDPHRSPFAAQHTVATGWGAAQGEGCSEGPAGGS